MKLINYILPIVCFTLCSYGTTSHMTYRNGYILDSKGKIVGNYTNGHIFDTARNVKGYYTTIVIHDNFYKIKGTYNNGFVKMNHATTSLTSDSNETLLANIQDSAEYRRLEKRLKEELEKSDFSSIASDYMKTDAYKAYKMYLHDNNNYVNLMFQGFLFNDLKGLYSYLIDDIIQSQYLSAPSIRSYIDNTDNEKSAVYKWQQQICLLMNVRYNKTKLSDTNKCKKYSNVFQNVRSICDTDNGKLWGINLYAPTLCIDTNRTVWSNQKDKNGELLLKGNCYIGKYPNDKNIANSIIDVYGQKWVTIALPLPSDSIERNTLFCHEMFHYWQDSLGHIPRIYNNTHIDNKDARVLLKLEWKAFYTACKAIDYSTRKTAIRDGLIFRKLRQEKYFKYYPDETAFEIHEGLAQYTGRKLSVSTDSIYLHILDHDMNTYMGEENLVRNYAYLSGVILGYLLDKSKIDWRQQVNGKSDLGLMLQKAYHINLPSNLDMCFQESKKQYDYNGIISFENHRDSIKSIEKQQLIALFTHNIKKLPLKNIQISFDPNSVVPLEGIGNIYKKARIIDNWGILETINDGVILISDDWKTVVIPYADSIVVKENVEETDKWKLTKTAECQTEQTKISQ